MKKRANREWADEFVAGGVVPINKYQRKRSNGFYLGNNNNPVENREIFNMYNNQDPRYALDLLNIKYSAKPMPLVLQQQMRRSRL